MMRNHFRQHLATFFSILCCVSGGMIYAWTSPLIPVLEKPTSPIKINHNSTFTLEFMCLLGATVGIPIATYQIDKIGPKRTLMFFNLVILIGWIFVAAASTADVLYVGRFLQGTCFAAYVAVPIYIAEIAHQNVRGLLSIWADIMVTLGFILIYVIGGFVSIVTSSLFGMSFLIVSFIGLLFVPMSPYYLLYQGKIVQAKSSLAWLRGDNEDVTEEFNEIAEAVYRQMHENRSVMDLFLVRSNLKALIILIVLDTAQHCCGVTALVMNIQQILEVSKMSAASQLTTSITFSLVMLFAALVGAYTVDFIGRKRLLLLSSILTSLFLLVLGSFFFVISVGVDISSYRWILVISLIGYGISFKIGIGTVGIVSLGEMLPMKVKALGNAIPTMVFTVASALSVYIFKLFYEYSKIYIFFYINSAFCVFIFFFVQFYVPETKGKTLEEIQRLLKSSSMSSLSNSMQYTQVD